MKKLVLILSLCFGASANAAVCNIIDPQGRTRGHIESALIYDAVGDLAGKIFSEEVYTLNRVHIGSVKNGVVYDTDRFVLARIVDGTAYNSNGVPIASGQNCTATELGAGTLLIFFY